MLIEDWLMVLSTQYSVPSTRTGREYSNTLILWYSVTSTRTVLLTQYSSTVALPYGVRVSSTFCSLLSTYRYLLNGIGICVINGILFRTYPFCLVFSLLLGSSLKIVTQMCAVSKLMSLLASNSTARWYTPSHWPPTTPSHIPEGFVTISGVFRAPDPFLPGLWKELRCYSGFLSQNSHRNGCCIQVNVSIGVKQYCALVYRLLLTNYNTYLLPGGRCYHLGCHWYV